MLISFDNKKNLKALVTTAAFGSDLHSCWVSQKSDKYEISYNRIDSTKETDRFRSMQPRLRAKIPKMLAYEDHPNYDYYIWADSRFSIGDDSAIERLVDKCIGVDACFFKHSARNSVQQELDFVISLMNIGNEYLLHRYAGEKMVDQVKYYNQDSSWEDNKLFECGIFIYSKSLIQNKNYNLMKEWFYHNCLWSVQDQLSLPYLLHKFSSSYKVLDGNVYSNSYFL